MMKKVFRECEIRKSEENNDKECISSEGCNQSVT